MDPTTKKRKTNPWWDYVQANKGSVEAANWKDKLKILAETWKTEKTKHITITTEHLLELHDNQARLKKELAESKEEIKRLRELVSYLEKANYSPLDD